MKDVKSSLFLLVTAGLPDQEVNVDFKRKDEDREVRLLSLDLILLLEYSLFLIIEAAIRV